jgi:hypothetical protein
LVKMPLRMWLYMVNINILENGTKKKKYKNTRKRHSFSKECSIVALYEYT